MKESEKFKIWLENIYISKKTGKPLTSGTQYITGIKALNKKFSLTGDGIYEKDFDLKQIRILLDKSENFHKDYSSHLNAFLKFSKYYVERENQNKRPLGRKQNPFKKQEVERIAIETTIKYFENLDYIVISKEKDNIGWDLEAKNNKETLLLEVKGLSGNVSSVELTPNEYKNLKEKTENYKLCIVTNTLKKPNLEIFSFNQLKNCWMNEKLEILTIDERIGARMWK